MSEYGEGQIDTTSGTSYLLEGRDKTQYPSKLYKADRPFGEIPDSEVAKAIPQLMDVAKRCFTHWTDDGEYFKKVLTERANRVSLVYDPSGENIVAFNLYEQAQIQVDGVADPVDMVYTHYAGVDPGNDKRYRGQGLMESSRTHDTLTMNPDVIVGCTASGAILKGVRATAAETGRQMYPKPDEPVPAAVAKVGRAVYTYLNGPEVGASVDYGLVRHGKGEYLRGDAPDPLQDKLPTNNDAILYTSLSPSFASKVGVALPASGS